MTALASTIRCSGCGYLADPDDPYPFRCPRAGTDDTDHVLVRVLAPGRVRFPPARAGQAGEEANPFLRYRTLMHSYHVAMARGMPDARYCELVKALDASVAATDGRGFRATPFARSAGLSDALGFAADSGVWVKDETGNVAGSHKGRHLMGILIHLSVMAELGLTNPGLTNPRLTDSRERPGLAIASCGNAALAAAVLAKAGGWALTVFVPPDADGGIVSRLRDLRATVVCCPRDSSALRDPAGRGDPAYHRLRAELERGALPFTTQGPENGLAIEGGETLGYELATDLPDGFDHLVVQVGGGALASSCAQALREAAELGALRRLPRMHTVQTSGAHPLERAYERVRAALPAGPSSAGPSPGDPSAMTKDAVGQDTTSLDAITTAVDRAARHRSAYMWPWETEPRSVAAGILDDETYDWRAVVEHMLATGGRPVVVSEDALLEASRLGVARTGIAVDPTGSSGLAGLAELRRRGEIGDHDRVAVLFTGIRRDS